MGEANFKLFMRLKNHLDIAAENSARKENLSPVLIPTRSKDKNEQLKLANEMVNVVDRATKEVCVTQLRYNVDKPENSNAQVRLYSTK